MIELRVLGQPRVDARDGRPVESLAHQTKRLALLAYLAAAKPRGPQRRDKLVALFWPDSDESRARAALNQALYVLRSRLGDVFKSAGNDVVALDAAAVWCDVAAFEELLDAGRPEDAITLYRGDLLDGFHIADAPEFERWVDDERARLRQRAADGAWAVAEARAAEGDVVQALRSARRAADLLPTDEAVVRRLMMFCRGLGDRAAAVRAYEAFAWRLAQEYELEPSPETRALAVAIREEEHEVAAPMLPEVAVTTIPEVPAAVASPVSPHPRDGAPAPPLRHEWAWSLTVGAAAVVAIVTLAVRDPSSEAATTTIASPWVSLLDVDDAPPLSVGLRGSTIDITASGDIVYVGRADFGRQLYLKARGKQRFTAVAGTSDALDPVFSPDGEWIAWVDGQTIRKIRITGGLAAEVCGVSAPPHGLSWGDDGNIVFALPAGLFRVSAAGGATPELIASTPGSPAEWYGWPDVLPGSEKVVMAIASDDGFELGVASLASGEVRRLGVHGAGPQYVSPGYLLWAEFDGALLAAPFDAEAGRLLGPPETVAEDVHVGMGGHAFMGVSPDALLYVPIRSGNRLALVDSLGREREPPSTLVGFDTPRFTGDGRQLVLIRRLPDLRLADIWMLDLRTHAMRRITSDRGSFGPVVSSSRPSRIAYASKPGGRPQGFGIRLLWVDSPTDSEELLAPEVNQRPRDFTPDGRSLVVQRVDPETGFDIWIAALDGSGKLEPYLRGPANERGAALSPDGRWMAWVSNEFGRTEIYVGEFPRLGTPVQVSRDGGIEPRWAGDGRTLFYRSERGLMKVEISAEAPLAFGPPRVLLPDARYAASAPGASYDVHPDGDLFAFVLPVEDRGDLLLRHGWQEALSASAKRD